MCLHGVLVCASGLRLERNSSILFVGRLYSIVKKVFVNWNALIPDFYLQLLLAKIHNKLCFSKQIIEILDVKNIGYDTKVINIIDEFYHAEECVIIAEPKYSSYCKKIIDELNSHYEKYSLFKSQQLFQLDKKFSEVVFFNSYKEKKNIIRDNPYITNSILEWDLLNEESSLIANIFGYIIGLFFKLKVLRCSLILSSMFLFWEYFDIFWSILSIWPLFFETHPLIISHNFFVGLLWGCCGFLSAANLFRSLLEFSNEQRAVRNGFLPLCSASFIFSSYSLQDGFLGLLTFLVIGFYSFFFSYYSGLSAIFLSIIHFVFLLSNSYLRFLIFLLSTFVIHAICQWKFIKLFLRI